MISEYIKDLDKYFEQNYSDKGKLAAIPGYEIPRPLKENGYGTRTASYLLINQKNPDELLKTFKEGLVDRDFSFNFAPTGIKKRVKDIFRNDAFFKVFPSICKNNSVNAEALCGELAIEKSTWNKILKGEYYPSKNLALAICIAAGTHQIDAHALMNSCGYFFDRTSVRDVVISYLILYRIFNPELVKEALKEYSITCIPLKNNQDI